METKLRLGGMALRNGVLVHGPTSFGVAIRNDDGSIETASGNVPRLPTTVSTPFLRGPVRLGESFALLPVVKRALPGARFSFERPSVVVAVGAGALGAAAIRRSPLTAGLREVVAALASLAPAMMSLRGGELTSYHGAEHVSIGTYESGERATKEHERCGSHLVGPLILTSAVAGALANRAPVPTRRAARVVGAVGALGASIELLGWMTRNPELRVSRALARPGYELQSRLSTTEPTAEQLDVANAALAACLEAEAHQLAG
jgi:uncharacterized protein YqhQ